MQSTPQVIERPKKDTINPLFKYLPVIGQGADLATTLINKHEGFRETNPLLPNDKMIIASKIGGAAIGYILTKALEKNHPKAAKFLSSAMGVGGIVPAGINIERMINK
jgi:hypothetical protein